MSFREQQQDISRLNEVAVLQELAEYIKQPLLRMAYKSELAQATKSFELLDEVAWTSSEILKRVDAVLMGYRSSEQQLQLRLSPIMTSALTNALSFQLKQYAQTVNFSVEHTKTSNKHPVLVHEPTFMVAGIALGTSLMETYDGLISNTERKLTIFSNLKKHNPEVYVTVGGGNYKILQALYERAQHIQLSAKIPGSKMTQRFFSGNASAVCLAEQLLNSMGSSLKPVRHKGQIGYRLGLTPSSQLELL